MNRTFSSDAPIISRWVQAPGYDRLLDRANALIATDIARPGHAHRLVVRSKHGRIDFEGSDAERFDYPCHELITALQGIEDASERTCEICGDSGKERPGQPDHVRCSWHAVNLRAH